MTTASQELSHEGLPHRNRFQRRRQATREQIVGAAERVMAEKGVHATKIADIAAAADVGVGTFYLHFETKQELFDELVADAVTRLNDTIQAARAGAPDVVEQIRLATRAVCRFARDNRVVFRLVFGHGGTYHDVVRDAQALFVADLAPVIRQGIAEGLFVAVEPTIAAEAIVGMTTQLLSWWTVQGDVPIEDLESTLILLVVRALSTATHA